MGWKGCDVCMEASSPGFREGRQVEVSLRFLTVPEPEFPGRWVVNHKIEVFLFSEIACEVFFHVPRSLFCLSGAEVGSSSAIGNRLWDF